MCRSWCCWCTIHSWRHISYSHSLCLVSLLTKRQLLSSLFDALQPNVKLGKLVAIPKLLAPQSSLVVPIKQMERLHWHAPPMTFLGKGILSGVQPEPCFPTLACEGPVPVHCPPNKGTSGSSASGPQGHKPLEPSGAPATYRAHSPDSWGNTIRQRGKKATILNSKTSEALPKRAMGEGCDIPAISP